MTNKECFDRANKNRDLALQKKLRENFDAWCKKNGRTPQNVQSMTDWFNEESV